MDLKRDWPILAVGAVLVVIIVLFARNRASSSQVISTGPTPEEVQAGIQGQVAIESARLQAASTLGQAQIAGDVAKIQATEQTRQVLAATAGQTQQAQAIAQVEQARVNNQNTLGLAQLGAGLLERIIH